MSRNFNAARRLAAAGCPVFPCDPVTEQPCVEWTECATTDIAALEALWQRHPDALPAIDLGKAGLLVAEIFSDNKSADGFQSFMQIAATYEWDIDPPVVSAPDSAPYALHIYFRQPAGEPLASDASLRGYGINIRGKGGYVIAPGAARRDGSGPGSKAWIFARRWRSNPSRRCRTGSWRSFAGRAISRPIRRTARAARSPICSIGRPWRLRPWIKSPTRAEAAGAGLRKSPIPRSGSIPTCPTLAAGAPRRRRFRSRRWANPGARGARRRRRRAARRSTMSPARCWR